MNKSLKDKILLLLFAFFPELSILALSSVKIPSGSITDITDIKFELPDDLSTILTVLAIDFVLTALVLLFAYRRRKQC